MSADIASLIDLLPAAARKAALESDADTARTSPVLHFGLSSTQVIEYMMKIESKFDIMIGDIDILEFGNKSLETIQDLISMQLGEGK